MTARRLNVHPNTVHHRLRRIADITGRDVRRVADLIDLLAGITILESNSAGRNNQHIG
jgi:purine catabolism regulator